MLGVLRPLRRVGAGRSTPDGPSYEEVCARMERLTRILAAQRDIAAADLDLESVMTLICERTSRLMRSPGA